MSEATPNLQEGSSSSSSSHVAQEGIDK